MASAAFARGRGAACVSVNKYQLLVLLCLAFVPHLQAAKEFQKNKTKINPASLRLKHAADHLINKDQLEQVIEYLQDAVDQANEQKNDHMRRITAAANEMETKWKILYPQMEQILMNSDMSSPADVFLKVSKQALEKVRIYTDLKKKSFTATAEDMERKLEDILKMSDFQEYLRTEL